MEKGEIVANAEQDDERSNAGVIVAATLGSLASLACIGGLVYYFMTKDKKEQAEAEAEAA